jgi:hypothetical protein
VEFDSIATVGELHERIEELFDASGWSTFVSCWLEACNIEPPPKRESREHRKLHLSAAPIDDSAAASPADVPSIEALRALPPSPRPDAAIIEPGLLNALPTMPAKVAGFLRHQTRDPPPWVYQESAAEKAEREFLQGEGCWTG